ncbi:MAG TPA: CehA/McbA family metallohydrolase [Thermomicrobiales bacterium]|nr:CehA/McbA family metallohydrolase [Thermomicrobiales bacterium]
MEIAAFSKPGSFYKGNIHLHSNHSDGRLAPADVVEEYRSRGYDFVAITDHFLDRDYLMGLVGRAEYEGAGEFINVNDTSALRSENFTTIFGSEIHGTGMANGTNWHIVAVGLPLDFAPWDGEESGAAIAERAQKAGAFVGIAHPAASSVTIEDAKQIIPFADSIEIYNHACNLFGMTDSWHFADILYTEGNRLSAYAADDAHTIGERDAFGGWVHVKAESLEPDALLKALKAGDFYSSTGPEITNVAIEGDEFIVQSSPATAILVTGMGGYRYKLGSADAPISEARFPLEDIKKMPYARVTVIGPNQERAWSNPIWFD